MRVIVCLMMLTFLLSGYCSSAHAKQAVIEAAHSLQIDIKTDVATDHDQDSSSHCLKGDCHSCCVLAVSDMIDAVQMPLPPSSLKFHVSDISFKDNQVWKLLRPPKSLV